MRPLVHPNPFARQATFAVPVDARNVSARIYDVFGRLVRRLDPSSTSTPGQLVWDGQDDRGRSLATGTYFCELSVDGRSQVVRVTLEPNR